MKKIKISLLGILCFFLLFVKNSPRNQIIHRTVILSKLMNEEIYTKIERGAAKGLSGNIIEETKKAVQEKIESGGRAYSPISNIRLMEMYEPIWKEYEYAQHYGTYHEEVWEEISIYPYAILLASAANEGDTLYYSFMDINQDGVVEMLIGRDYASYMDEDIRLLTVYCYYFSDGRVHESCVSDRTMIHLYEGGILECLYGEGLYTSFTYLTLKKGRWECLEELEIREGHKIPENAPKNVDPVYLWERNKGEVWEEEVWEYISEEEFYVIQQEYTKAPMQIEWKSFAEVEEKTWYEILKDNE